MFVCTCQHQQQPSSIVRHNPTQSRPAAAMAAAKTRTETDERSASSISLTCVSVCPSPSLVPAKGGQQEEEESSSRISSIVHHRHNKQGTNRKAVCVCVCVLPAAAATPVASGPEQRRQQQQRWQSKRCQRCPSVTHVAAPGHHSQRQQQTVTDKHTHRERYGHIAAQQLCPRTLELKQPTVKAS